MALLRQALVQEGKGGRRDKRGVWKRQKAFLGDRRALARSEKEIYTTKHGKKPITKELFNLSLSL